MDAIGELVYQAGKLAHQMGEAWRLEHAELMDAYEAVLHERDLKGDSYVR